MKEKTVFKLRRVTYLLLVLISTLFTCSLFEQLAVGTFNKAIMVTFGFALEIIKLYLFLLVKSHYKDKEKVMTIALFIVYLGLAFISGLATLGFAMSNIEEQSYTAEAQNLSITDLENQVKNYDFLILKVEAGLNSSIAEQEKMNGMNKAFYSGQEKMKEQQVLEMENYKSLLRERSDLVSQIQTLSIDEVEVSSAHTFELIGTLFRVRGKPMTGQDTILMIFVLLVVFLELCICLTSENIEKPISLKYSSTELNQYVDSLMQNGKAKKLISDWKISEQTGISLETCKRYRFMMLHRKVSNKSLIVSVRGGSKANFSYEMMKKIIQSVDIKEVA